MNDRIPQNSVKVGSGIRLKYKQIFFAKKKNQLYQRRLVLRVLHVWLFYNCYCTESMVTKFIDRGHMSLVQGPVGVRNSNSHPQQRLSLRLMTSATDHKIIEIIWYPLNN